MNTTTPHLLGPAGPSRVLLLPLFLLLFQGAVLAQSLTSVQLTPATVAGGKPSSGQASLSAGAPAGGAIVNLSSSQPGVAQTPAWTLVQPGATASTFTVTTQAVASPTTVTISATYSGVTRTTTLTVEPGPPATLFVGTFILAGATYTSSDWDPGQNLWTDVTGDATVSLAADGESHPIAVHFEGLTIAPLGPAAGNVTGGSATYTPPGAPPQPESLVLAGGFTLLLDGLTMAPTSALATGRLQLPSSLIDAAGGQCKPGTLSLGTFPFTPSCQFYVAQIAGSFGPWVLGPHGMTFSGINFVADFSLSQSPSLSPAVPLDFRGVVLGIGETTAPSGPVISNTGYLQAQYSFTNAVIVAAGMTAELKLAAEHEFLALEPWGYRIRLRQGHLNVTNSVVTGGAFTQLDSGSTPWGEIVLPSRAIAFASSGNAVTTTYNKLDVQADLDLSGEVFLGGGAHLTWGELGVTGNPQRFYDVGPLVRGRFYLSATPRPRFWPLDTNGEFKDLSFANPPLDLEAQAMQGVTFLLWQADPGDASLFVRTPDTPSAQAIKLKEIAPESWINVGARGVHADLFSERGTTDPKQTLDLVVGPNHLESYVPGIGSNPFSLTLEKVTSQQPPRQYFWLFQLVESAVYRSDLNGQLHLPFPMGADVQFANMRFTSTAHNTGARVTLSEPVEMSYWALDLIPKQIDATAAVMSVKTGQIFLTAAGIQEPRHFAKPFLLLWGEILSTGHVGSFLFDQNFSGQAFDGFAFVPEVVALSDPILIPDGAPPYLHVAGTAHFDFFGETYLDIRDHRHDDNPNAPHNGRAIALADGGEHGAKPTDYLVGRKWNGDFGSLDFTIRYDEGDQDGFLSDPQAAESNEVEVAYLDQPVAASLDLSSQRACVSIYEAQSRAVAFPFLPSFGAIKRITGCGCIEEGALQRLVLSSELDVDAEGGLLHTGEHVGVEKIITPATSELLVNGHMFLNVAGSGDVQVIGQIHLLIDRESDFFEGDVKGKIDASSYLGFIQLGGLSAEGQLGWHLGSFANDGYQLLQGKLAVNVVAPAGAAGVGVEGGFLLGVNAPREKAWVIVGTDPRFDVNLELLPPKLTGAFGFAKVSSSINAYIVSGGFDAYLGVGGFLGSGSPLPSVFGHVSASIWGEFLGGLVSGSAWLDAQLAINSGFPMFQGTVGLEVCAVWVICATEEVTLTVDDEGFKFSN